MKLKKMDQEVEIANIMIMNLNLIKTYVLLETMIMKNNNRIARRKKFITKLLLCMKRRKRSIVNRRIWKLERKSTFWEKEVPTYTEAVFKENFRVDRSGFNKLVKFLDVLVVKDTSFRAAIQLEKRIAIALYALGSSDEYRTIANLFGIGRTTVGEMVRDFCEAVVYKLQNIYLSTYPITQTKLEDIVNGFQRLGFPQCMGAIDGCHIEVCPPKEMAADYCNYNGRYSVVLLAITDHRCNFTYVNVGSPGRNNNSNIFENSAIKKEHTTNNIYIDNVQNINGVPVPVLLIGDSEFQLSKFMMKPFPFRTDQPQMEKTFNYHLYKCKRVVENSFDRLKARFRRLLKGLEVDINSVPLIIKACCILNNFCNEHNDEVPDHGMVNLQVERNQPPCETVTGNNNNTGTHIRNTIAQYFSKLNK